MQLNNFYGGNNMIKYFRKLNKYMNQANHLIWDYEEYGNAGKKLDDSLGRDDSYYDQDLKKIFATAKIYVDHYIPIQNYLKIRRYYFGTFNLDEIVILSLAACKYIFDIFYVGYMAIRIFYFKRIAK